MMSGSSDRLDLTGLAKNYGYYFGDEEIVSDSEDWLYICDSETYELLLFQQKKDNTVTSKLGDWHGRKCYEFIEGKDHPCEFCPLKISEEITIISGPINVRCLASKPF